MIYRVSADIRHTAGTLAGIVSPAGYSFTVSTLGEATSAANWINRMFRADEVISSSCTQSSYVFASKANVEAV